MNTVINSFSDYVKISVGCDTVSLKDNPELLFQLRQLDRVTASSSEFLTDVLSELQLMPLETFH